MTAPNTAGSVAGPGASPETALEVAGGLDVSGATGPAPGTAGAATAICPGAAGVGAGDGGSVLASGAPVAAGVASADGARMVALGAAVPGLLATGWTRAGSFFTESDV